MASLTLSSCWTRAPTYSTAAGTLARSDSTTALRPATNSAASPAPRCVRSDRGGVAAPERRVRGPPEASIPEGPDLEAPYPDGKDPDRDAPAEPPDLEAPAEPPDLEAPAEPPDLEAPSATEGPPARRWAGWPGR